MGMADAFQAWAGETIVLIRKFPEGVGIMVSSPLITNAFRLRRAFGPEQKTPFIFERRESCDVACATSNDLNLFNISN